MFGDVGTFSANMRRFDFTEKYVKELTNRHIELHFDPHIVEKHTKSGTFKHEEAILEFPGTMFLVGNNLKLPLFVQIAIFHIRACAYKSMRDSMPFFELFPEEKKKHLQEHFPYTQMPSTLTLDIFSPTKQGKDILDSSSFFSVNNDTGIFVNKSNHNEEPKFELATGALVLSGFTKWEKISNISRMHVSNRPRATGIMNRSFMRMLDERQSEFFENDLFSRKKSASWIKEAKEIMVKKARVMTSREADRFFGVLLPVYIDHMCTTRDSVDGNGLMTAYKKTGVYSGDVDVITRIFTPVPHASYIAHLHAACEKRAMTMMLNGNSASDICAYMHNALYLCHQLFVGMETLSLSSLLYTTTVFGFLPIIPDVAYIDAVDKDIASVFEFSDNDPHLYAANIPYSNLGRFIDETRRYPYELTTMRPVTNSSLPEPLTGGLFMINKDDRENHTEWLRLRAYIADNVTPEWEKKVSQETVRVSMESPVHANGKQR
jgi:hypothetical protein